MTDNRGTGILGGLVLAAGFASILYYTVAAPIYITRRWGIHGLAWVAASLTAMLAFLIPAEDRWLSSANAPHYGLLQSVATLIHRLASWPWPWMTGGLFCFAIVLTVFPEIRHPHARSAETEQADRDTPSSRGGA